MSFDTSTNFGRNFVQKENFRTRTGATTDLVENYVNCTSMNEIYALLGFSYSDPNGGAFHGDESLWQKIHTKSTLIKIQVSWL